ncbi:hypothetical protein P2H44_03580 [Albimonas sp. CAU 1670]|uniref:hypothetical protein n=1 Tax=Albimonas sp. CAU 1670 TaxID=3032599 RepID=UPI0023DC8FCF|nr:hypothetical protein [Albimonas sp. CAU 1670]MDF2231626.1 hypothetical protein [Albimonas sp. CAU 1670]
MADRADRPEKIFVLGMGAVKGGTTWLAKYLQSYPEFHKGVMKEPRIWETRTRPEFDEYTIPLWQVRDLGHAFRWTFRTFPFTYFWFLDRVFRRHQVRITADLSPTYTSLDAETLRRIRDGFARRGVTVKPVLLMRDPVERIWSQVRMVMRRGVPERYIRIDLDVEGNLRHFHPSVQCRRLTAPLGLPSKAELAKTAEACRDAHDSSAERFSEARRWWSGHRLSAPPTAAKGSASA